MKTKKCNQCDNVKLISEFNKLKASKDGYQHTCRECKKNYYQNNKEYHKEQRKEYRKNNQEQINEYQKEYKKNNKEQIKEYQKEYKKNNQEQINERKNEYQKNRKKTDPLFKLTGNIRSLTYKALKNKAFTKQNKTAEILGCSFEEFKQHIESKFESWMNWENQGKYNGTLNYGWDVDHKIPLSSAKTEEELLKLSHFTNLQPLCSKINRDIKKDKIN